MIFLHSYSPKSKNSIKLKQLLENYKFKSIVTPYHCNCSVYSQNYNWMLNLTKLSKYIYYSKSVSKKQRFKTWSFPSLHWIKKKKKLVLFVWKTNNQTFVFKCYNWILFCFIMRVNENTFSVGKNKLFEVN